MRFNINSKSARSFKSQIFIPSFILYFLFLNFENLIAKITNILRILNFKICLY